MPNPEDDRLWKEASQTVSARPSEERPTTENSGDRGSQILPRADVSGARCPERLDRLSDLSEEWIGRRRRTLTRTCLRSQRVLGVLEALDEKASLPGSLHRLSARIDENAARELATLWARVARDAARVLGERVEGEIDRAREDRRASAA